MYWEQAILNRIYKTMDFKIPIANINLVKDKAGYKKRIENYIEKYNIDIKCNDNGALYRKTNEGIVEYLDYHTNYLFLVFMYSFELEHKFIKYEDYNLTIIYSICEDNDENTIKIPHQFYEGLSYSHYFKKLLIDLLLIRENIKVDTFMGQLKKIDDHLRFRSFLIGYNASHYGKLSFVYVFRYISINYYNQLHNMER